jgi:hypothetical protein
MVRTTNAAERLAARYIPKTAVCILEHSNGSAWYSYELNGKLLGIGFWGTSAKAHSHYSYRTEDQRNQAIEQFKQSVERSLALKTTQKAAIAATPNPYKVGDIVNTSWGYDQTNVDFFIITRVSAGCVWVRPVVQDFEATGFMCGQCWPKMPIEMVGDETRQVVRGGRFSINGHGASLTTGDKYSSSYA